MEGNILHQFNAIMNFFSRNLKRVQIGTEFNQQGKLEIPYSSLVEFIVNALVHRSLNQKAPIRVFIFDDRVEIHSPGTLPNGLTVDDIIHGTSMPRNTFLFDNAIHLLPYTGAGSGITRAMSERHDVIFTNDEKTSEFLITIPRDESNQVEGKSNEVEGKSNEVEKKSNQVEGESNQVGNEVEGKSNEVSDLDTEHSYSNITRKPLTNKQKDILNFCSVPRTASEIMDRLGISNQTRNRERHIMPLVTAGYLQLTNPDNPKASNQKYKRTSMGK